MAYKTCVSIAETTPAKVLSTLKKALQKSDYAEIRFDFLAPKDIPMALELTKKYNKQCVFTLRPKNQGGKFQGTEKERISILKLIAEYNPYFLDLEFSAANKDLIEYIKKTKTQILVSWHDFHGTPSVATLSQKYQKMKKVSKNIKLVTTAKSIKDTASVLSLYKKQGSGLIAFAMGDYGRISRILCLHLGAPYTYVSLGKPVAPGQFSLDEIKSLQSLQK
ncbi:type I 3-dehydroquinate dehydratase [Candidatus Nitrosotenuis aquarius]|uniref:type I 3-dehydroquinate dehydratase n=1 Tax=Candidatus Nitrosotenuis aquarius TaxID=1846278 RepID=UPI000C1DFB41|nr:type I 3-dehydroquinate dehydratase [Candidatus Nitrosotenuis aquarius]